MIYIILRFEMDNLLIFEGILNQYLPPKALLDGVVGVDVGLPALAAWAAAAALTAANPAKDDAFIGPPGPLDNCVEWPLRGCPGGGGKWGGRPPPALM